MATPDFEFFDHTADIGVRIHGATLPVLFTHAARALYAGMGQFHQTDHWHQQTIELTSGTPEDLLHDWLEELLFEFVTHRVLFDEFAFARLDAGHLTATVRGATVDFARSQVREEIKAVTYHQLHVEQKSDGTWLATVIFDV